MALNQLLPLLGLCKIEVGVLAMVSLTMAYNFENNILKLSKTKEINQLQGEWEFVGKERKEDGLCICGHRMKKVEYYVNTLTGHVIQVGSDCRKKLRLLESNRKLNPILKEFVECSQLGYANIFDLLRYCEESRNRMVKLIMKRIDISSDIATLQILLKELLDLVDLHIQNTITCEYINELIEKVQIKIQGIEKKEKEQREQREKKDREMAILREEREKQEREYRERVNKRKEKLAIERRERERKLAIEREEVEKKYLIEREKLEKEKDLQRQVIEKEEIEEKEKKLEFQKKQHLDIWNRYYTKPSNPSPAEP